MWDKAINLQDNFDKSQNTEENVVADIVVYNL